MKKLLLPIIWLLFFAQHSAASDGAGTESPFSLGAGARDIALGGANIARSSNWTAPFWNASSLVHADRFSLGGFHSRLFASDVSYQYLGAVYPTIDFGTFGIGIFRLGVDGIEKRDVNNLRLGEFSDNRLGVYLAYGRSFVSYDFGLAIMFEHHSIDNYVSTSSPGINLSVGRNWDINFWKFKDLAVVINGQNLIRPGIRLADEVVKYPYRIDFGLSATFLPTQQSEHSALVSAAFSKTDFMDPTLSLGIEYQFQNLLFIRGGLNHNNLSYGLGLNYNMLSFDYVVVDRDLGALHMFNLTSEFGASVKEKRLTRAARQEKEIISLMSKRLVEQNEKMVLQLVDEGKMYLAEGDLQKSLNKFDRALFLASSSNRDTVEIANYVGDVRMRLDDVLRKSRYSAFLDSAWVNINAQDFLAGRYFANLALNEVSNSEEADSLFNLADLNLKKELSEDQLIETRLEQADSLITFGNFELAINLLESLEENDRANSRVTSAMNRARFEQWRSITLDNFDKRKYQTARKSLDSALAIYPGHQWCNEMLRKIENVIKRVNRKKAPVENKPLVKLSAEMKKEVEENYLRGQKLFKEGNLKEAVNYWEKVEAKARNYKQNRKYLINAYKYVGVEFYSKNLLEEAIEVWQKASKLDPDNQEIAGYINRTENEIKKLMELSYDR